MSRRRRLWRRAARRFGPGRLVFLDEAGANTAMTRRYGRAKRGERVRAAAPAGTWQALTVLAAVRPEGAFAPFAFRGACDGAAFRTYVEKVLAPELRPGEVVVMDNLGPHKAPGVAKAIAAAGAAVRFLPPYSPDLNPAEPLWSKVKGHLRSLAARTAEALHEAFGSALRAVTPHDCRGWFNHCYPHMLS